MIATNTNPAARDDGVRQEFLIQSGPASNSQMSEDAQAFLLFLLGVATLRSKLIAVDLDSISIALKQGLISLEGAIAWLDDLSLFEIVVQRPEIAEGGRQ
jgi:hypothetical protein